MRIETVLGPIAPHALGTTLPHEHVLVDFIGADKIGPHRWDRQEVHDTLLPRLLEAKRQGVRGFVDCTPAYLGRDPRLLRDLARSSGLHILTCTGLYKEPCLPPYAFTDSLDALAARWMREACDGIDGSEVRPGFIKIAVNPGRLIPIQQKIVRAAARCSRRTGLAIACHSGSGSATMEALAILREEAVPAERFIFVHADAEPDRKWHLEAARAGAWVEYDSVGWRPIQEHVDLVWRFMEDGHLDRLLVSHDAGWYHPGEPGGGDIKPFTRLLGDLLPALERRGLTSSQRRSLLVDNPRRAFTIHAPA